MTQPSQIRALACDDAVVASRLQCVDNDLDVLIEQGPDGLSTIACEDALKQIERSLRRLSTLQTRIVGAVTERRMRAAAEVAEATGASKSVATGRARRSVEDFLADQLGMAPSDARAATTDGQRRGTDRQLDNARDAGDVGPRQARLVAEFLEKLRTSSSARLSAAELGSVETEAIKQASRLHPVELSRWLRRKLGQLDARRAELDESTRRRNRHAAFTTTDDGMWRLSATLSGVDAGLATQAIERFRAPDTADIPEGQRRSPGQITADAFVQMCRAALEADTSKATKSGARPHIVVTIDYQTLIDGAGTAEIERIGPVPYGEVRRVLADAGVARLLVDSEGLPVEAGPEVRTVPAGLRRLLVSRDDGCIASSCSIPARWCQVAHLDRPFRLGGQLSPDNAALMCHHHHTRFDLHGWRVVWDRGRPQLQPPATAFGRSPVPSTVPNTASEAPGPWDSRAGPCANTTDPGRGRQGQPSKSQPPEELPRYQETYRLTPIRGRPSRTCRPMLLTKTQSTP